MKVHPASVCTLLAVASALALAACSSHRPTSAPLTPTAGTPGTSDSSAATTASTPATGRTRTTAPVTPTVVPTSSQPTKPSVALSSPAPFGDGVTVQVVKASAVTSSGQGPGEISGQPAVAFTLRMTNASSSAVSLDTTSVTAVYGSGQTPASPSDGSPADPLHGTLAKGRAAQGVYVFLVPTSQRAHVTLEVSYRADRPAIVLSGRVPS